MKLNKLLKKFALCVMVIMSFMSLSFATGYIVDPDPTVSPIDDGFKNGTNAFIGTLRWIGYAIAIGMVIYVGIRYVMAAADERASMKGVLVKVVIGALILVFANTIVNMVIEIATKNNT